MYIVHVGVHVHVHVGVCTLIMISEYPETNGPVYDRLRVHDFGTRQQGYAWKLDTYFDQTTAATCTCTCVGHPITYKIATKNHSKKCAGCIILL